MVGDLKLDRVQHLVERAGLRTELTAAKEFALLEYLMRHAGRQVTRSMIIEMCGILRSTQRLTLSTSMSLGAGKKSSLSRAQSSDWESSASRISPCHVAS